MCVIIRSIGRFRLVYYNLTSQETIHKFANDVDAELTIMQNGMLFFQDAGRKKTLIYNLLDKLPKGNLITDLN